jgi:hypothetical protein
MDEWTTEKNGGRGSPGTRYLGLSDIFPNKGERSLLTEEEEEVKREEIFGDLCFLSCQFFYICLRIILSTFANLT